MKILVVAYACDPYRGSESGVGWAAVCRIARHHDVWVLANDSNRAGWERGASEGIIPSNVHVRFLRKSRNHLKNRFLARLQDWLRVADFNSKVLTAAHAWHAEVGFDISHQVTIAAWRMPSPLWQLPIPSVWGPIGGAGWMPPAFRSMLSPKSRAFETLRDWNTWMMERSKTFRDCIRNTAVVIAANEETEQFLKPHRQGNCMLNLHVSSISESKIHQFARPMKSNVSGPLRLFAGGNIEGRKGVSLALRALADVAKQGIDFHYTVAGGGPEIQTLRKLSNELGIEDRVDFHPGYSGDNYLQALQNTDVYFLPSFRETMGMTLVEAILAGCYPVVADTSAQGEIVRRVGGIAVKADSQEAMVKGLADALVWCHENRETLAAHNAIARERVSSYFSAERYDSILDEAYATAVGVRS
jgi:glycosyltransferase involved in cell wall biosynthesis